MRQFKDYEKLKQWCADNDHNDAIIFADPDYSSAVIGFSNTGAIIYSHKKMVEWLMKSYDLSETDAIEFIDKNTIPALPYGDEKRPVILYEID